MKCCNPECVAPFDYREGRLIRVSRPVENDNNSQARPVVKHFWLCGKCAAAYEFELRSDSGVAIRPRDRQSLKESCTCISTAA
jgi:hypothetical protein